ncbi:hypothetical protein C5C94_10095 [Rathayibacter sp. AY1C3]|nr:hypothetical protein C5B92_11050 [Rathayibacter sp. AY1A4]PPG80885.1 hypothetical protein C5C52_09760 [Rathayibacter sp. AY1E5]PPH30759.1 hypothetical protein C5C94_10095 [Rathayibacter sp. AY1C3]PPH51923.1 hypothetical protein C5D25_17455 [Rathayibacter sp. AY1D7]PPI26490.1 hypothetical protein C5D66_16615 [Rathayibacter sp. AY1B4]
MQIHLGGNHMFLLQLMQFGPAAAGLLLAAGAHWLTRRYGVALPARVRASTAVGMILTVIAAVVFSAWWVYPWWVPAMVDWLVYVQLSRFLIPLVLTVVPLAFLAIPARSEKRVGTAELAPRTVMTFTSRGRLIGTAIVTLLAVVVAIVAGAASTTDEAGRHVMFELPISENTTASTTIYGWWYSLPCLAVLLLLLLLTALVLRGISLPPLSADRVADSAQRATRTRNVLAALSGGLLLHLGVVLVSLYGTSTMRTELSAGASGQVQFGTSFAALGSFFQVSGYACFVLAFAFWGSVLLSTLAASSRRLATSSAR